LKPYLLEIIQKGVGDHEMELECGNVAYRIFHLNKFSFQKYIISFKSVIKNLATLDHSMTFFFLAMKTAEMPAPKGTVTR